MLFELALLMVAVPASYTGVLLLRRRAAPVFAAMLCATGAAAWISYVGRRDDGPAILDLIGAVAIGAGACLLFIGPAVRRVARWAVATDRLRLAGVLVEIGDLLQPGTAGPDDKASLAALRDVRAGEVDGAIDALRAARAKAPAELHRAFDERIALLYVVAMRWADAVAHAEATLFPTTPAPEPVDPVAPAEPGAPADPAAPAAPRDLTSALGMSPPVWVELIAAYGRLGQLDRAAAMAETFDRAAHGEAGLAWLVHRVRLVFLAAAGRTAPVERLLAQRAGDEIRPASRLFWTALAAERAGDRAAARAAYQAAIGHARRVPRVQAAIRDALDKLDRAAPATLSPEVARIADALAATEVTLPKAPRRRRVLVTPAVVAVNVVVAAVTALVVGSPGDIGAVVRSGGSVRAAVDHGEWWRLASSVFVHVGWIHLAINLIGLWSIGRLAEALFGPARLLAIYAVAGLAGAAASHAYGVAGVSAGASGAIFGVLGALVVELVIAGKRYPRPGRNALVGALVFVALVQLSAGFLYPVIDQWSHGVGLASGAAAAALLSTHGPAVRARLWLARGIAGAAALAFAVAGALVVATPYARTLEREGTHVRALRGVEATVPTSWLADADFLADRDNLGMMTLDRAPAAPAATPLDTLRANARANAKDIGFTEAVAAADRLVPLPAGWTSAELVVTSDDDLGSTQRFRAVVFAHGVGGDAVIGILYAPEILARDAPEAYAAMITSAHVAPGSKVAPPAPPR